MPLDLETTRAWERNNEAGICLAQAVHALRGDPDHRARGNALDLLNQSRKAQAASLALVDAQIAALARSLQVSI